MTVLDRRLEKIRTERVEKEREEYMSVGKLMWRRFKKHALARIGMAVLAFLYFVAIFADFISPYGTSTRLKGFTNAPPTRIHVVSNSGNLRTSFVYAVDRSVNPETFRSVYTEVQTEEHPVRFFVQGEKYKFLGLWKTDRHLFGVKGASINLFGTDNVGRDIFSRTLGGARVSLFIGLGGVFIAFILGCIIGGISGYFGGLIDEAIQRVIDLLISIPTLPLWIALSAAVPRDWSVVNTYFAITIVLSVVGWTGLARVVRGKLLSLRDLDFVIAARVSGATDLNIIISHLLPNFFSYLIVNITLTIPGMILGETALSFIGLGMQEPAVSWGVLLQDTMNFAAIVQQPWKLIPTIFIVITVLMYNFVGDGLRDAADPYSL